MIHIEGTLVSEDLLLESFCCDLAKCQGACCNSEGESGAPLDEEELQAMRDLVEIVWEDLTPRAQQVIREEGPIFQDAAGDWVTRCVDGRDCVYCTYDSGGMCLCAIEKAWREGRFKTLPTYREGKEPFMKPVSCHLYPVRLKHIGDYLAVNYDRQDKMCGCAQKLGRRLNIKVWQSLKDALIRRFGESWYEQLSFCAREIEENGLFD